MYEQRKSKQLSRAARRVIVGGAQAHKRASLYAPCPYPAYAVRAKGSKFWDADGNAFIDYLMGFGPILLGHAYPRVDRAAKKQIDSGQIFNVAHPAEIELARTLVRLIPSAEMVTYFISGSAATSGAIKIARAVTGRKKVVRCGYHGWHDWCMAARGALHDTARHTLSMRFNDPDSLRRLFRKHKGAIACVITEPSMIIAPEPGYLDEVARITRRHGALFVLDEIKTGFRFALGGAQKYFGVTPDLCTVGKAMGNGYPIAAVCGRREIMDSINDVWLAGTFNGWVPGLVAALETIREMRARRGTQHLWRQGRRLMKGLNEIAERRGIAARAAGLPPMPFLSWPHEEKPLKQAFYTETVQRGLFLPPDHPWFLSLSHSDRDIARTLNICDDALKAALR